MNNSESPSTPDSSNNQSDQHEIYAGYKVQLTPAPIWQRAAAYAADLSLISIFFYALFILLIIIIAGGVAAFGNFLKSLLNDESSIIIMLIIFAILMILVMLPFHIYFIYFESKQGSTPGKKLFGIRVLSLDGTKLTRGQAITREFFRWIDVGLLFPGIISMLLNKKNQRIGDMVSSTLVIYSKSEEKALAHLYLARDQYLKGVTALEPQPISKEATKNFLRFSNLYFLKKEKIDEATVQGWDDFFRQQISSNALQIDRESLLLFFAEHCFQEQKKSREGDIYA